MSKVMDTVKGAKDIVAETAGDFYQERGRRVVGQGLSLGIVAWSLFKLGAADHAKELAETAWDNRAMLSLFGAGLGGYVVFSGKEFRKIRLTDKVQHEFSKKTMQRAGGAMALAGLVSFGALVNAEAEDGNYVQALTDVTSGSNVRSAEFTSTPAECALPADRSLMSVDQIKTVQNQYFVRGLYGADEEFAIQVDGIYGDDTLAAENAFQVSQGIDDNLDWNAQTRDALFEC